MTIEQISQLQPRGVVDGTCVVPITLSSGESPSPAARPVQFGICLPKGFARAAVAGRLQLSETESVAIQAEPLTRHPDGSLHWVLVDAILPARLGNCSEASVIVERADLANENQVAGGNEFTVKWDEQTVKLRLDNEKFELAGGGLFRGAGIAFEFTDSRENRFEPTWDSLTQETAGSVRNTFLLSGTIGAQSELLNIRCRLSCYAEIGSIKLDVCLHNPRAAKHPGGLWDLGDPGSVLFEDFSVRLLHTFASRTPKQWRLESDGPAEHAECEWLHLYQDSSGGENWNSSNHMNREGRVPCQFRGYRFAQENVRSEGNRATPVFGIGNTEKAVGVVFPEFWQQFPKSLEVTGGEIRVGLFPRETDDLHELQGGEQKTTTFWVNCARGHDSLSSAIQQGEAVLDSVVATPSRDWYAEAGAVPDGTNIVCDDRFDLDRLLNRALEGEQSLFKKREEIDEYGWRNFGELVADHEEAYFDGSLPLVSHYNNQFDPIYGFLLNFLRSGDRRLFELGDALARHVADIDIYHTDEDKWGYNGGMFWHTDHYRDARTATHRSYSGKNFPETGDYGGGPCNEQNYTTGLFLHYCLTGRPESRDVVLELAEWVMQMDDGKRSLFRFIAPGPTGLASATREETFHGPGRGAGNSINALLDAWRLCGKSLYLSFAETLIRRCIHPQDDLGKLDLLNAEDRWSYTVFLTSLQKFLKVKTEAEQFDERFQYARASLVHYATWMAENEGPYLDRADELEYPTETWPAQDLRKANVLRNASGFVAEPLRSKFLEQGNMIAERAWSDLWSFETASCARPLAILMVEGLKERTVPPPCSGEPAMNHDLIEYGPPTRFIGQKTKIKRMVKRPIGFAKGLLGK